MKRAVLAPPMWKNPVGDGAVSYTHLCEFDQKLYDESIRDVGLKQLEKEKVSNLSGGQKQRVAILRSIMSQCKIIFADEPTAALDVRTREQIMLLLKKLNKESKKTILLITHDPNVASYADKVFFLFKGEFKKILKGQSEKVISKTFVELELANV